MPEVDEKTYDEDNEGEQIVKPVITRDQVYACLVEALRGTSNKEQ